MTNRRVVDESWRIVRDGDLDALESLLHPDVVVTYPQSGEVIRGRDNVIATVRQFPTDLPTGADEVHLDTTEKTAAIGSSMPFGMSLVTIVDDGELVVSRAILTYPTGDVFHTCSIFKVRSRLIAEEVTYFARPFDAPEWRKEWVDSP